MLEGRLGVTDRCPAVYSAQSSALKIGHRNITYLLYSKQHYNPNKYIILKINLLNALFIIYIKATNKNLSEGLAVLQTPKPHNCKDKLHDHRDKVCQFIIEEVSGQISFIKIVCYFPVYINKFKYLYIGDWFLVIDLLM